MLSLRCRLLDDDFCGDVTEGSDVNSFYRIY